MANIRGTSRGDTLRGTDQADVIQGLGGADLLLGQGGADRLDGGDGADTLDSGTGNDVIDGGTGTDTVTYAGRSLPRQLTVDLESGVAYVGSSLEPAELDQLLRIEAAVGTAGNDILLGGAGNDRLFGGAGNDRLDGRGGRDLLDGGTGQDTLDLGNATGGAVVDLSAGTATSGADTDTLVSIETVVGSDFADRFTGAAGADSYFSRAGRDTVRGLGGDDDLTVAAGASVDGGTGNDVLQIGGQGGSGPTRVEGGAGRDSLILNLDGDPDVRIDLAARTIAIGGETGRFTGVERLTGGDEDDTFLGGAGDDILSGYYETFDGGGDNLLDGRGGNDVLLGASGRDTLRGGDGRDNLIGAASADTLDGGAGDDLVEGGSGDDRIVGGAGADRFQVSFGGNGEGREASGTDAITDYNGAAGDRLAISVFDIEQQAGIRGQDLFGVLDTNGNGRLDNADTAVEFANATLDFTVSGGRTTLTFETADPSYDGEPRLNLTVSSLLVERDFVDSV